MKTLFLSLTAVLVILNTTLVSAAPKSDGAIFQIVKATDSRVWRLNKQTGEMAVCSLDGEQLICTSSANAIEVPKQSYGDRQAAKQRSMEAEKRRREEQRKNDMAFLDRVIEAVRSLVSASMEREAN